MSIDTTKHIKALLIAPLIGPIIFYAVMLIESESAPDMLAQFYVFIDIFVVACPVSYLIAIFIGIPYLLFLEKNNHLSSKLLIWGGMFIGCLAFILIFTVPWVSSMEESISFGQLLYLGSLGIGGSILGGCVAYTYAKLAGISSENNEE